MIYKKFQLKKQKKTNNNKINDNQSWYWNQIIRDKIEKQ